MPRPLKPSKIKTVRAGPYNTPVDIMFDRNTLNFFGKLGTNEVRASSVEECEFLARELARTWKPDAEAWKPYIDLRCDTGSFHNIEFGIRYERMEIMRNVQGKLLERPHEKDAADDSAYWDKRTRKQRREEGLDVHECHHSPDRLIPYSDDIWRDLEAIQNRIETIGKRLRKVGKDDNPRALLDELMGILGVCPTTKPEPGTPSKPSSKKPKRKG